MNRMETIFQDVRYGLRMLRRKPGFTLVAVLTLALGIGANTAIFSVIQNVLLRPLPFSQPEHLVQIWNSYLPAFPQLGVSPGDYQDWHREQRSLSAMGGFTELTTGFNLTGEGEPQRVETRYATSDLFPLLGVRPVVGRGFNPEEDKPGSSPVVMLSHKFWESRYGGDPGVVGRTLTLDGRRYIVVGVLPAAAEVLRTADLWMPFGQSPDDLSEHIHHGVFGVGRLKPGVAIAQAQAEFTELNHQEEIAFPDSHKHWGVVVGRLENPAAAKLRRTLLVLFGAVGLVLLIACVNLVNLLLARNAAREKEIGLRTALGATPLRLLRQLLTETTLLSFIGGAVGLMLAGAGIRILSAMVPADLVIVEQSRLSLPVLLFTLALCLGAGIACGLLPALQARQTNLSNILKQGGKGTGAFGRHRVHDLLVICEVALALIPLVGAGLLLRSFHHLLQVDPGIQTDHILTMDIEQPSLTVEEYLKQTQEQQTALSIKQALEFQQIAEKIQGLPGVKSVGGVSTLPFASGLREASRFVVEGQPLPDSGVRPVAQFRTASEGYFSTVGIRLLSGRWLNQADWPLQNIMVNETMARRFWPETGPIGKRIDMCSLDPKPCWHPIVGVVSNVHQFGLDAGPTYDVYFTGGWTGNLVIRTASDPGALAFAAAQEIHKIDPALPVTHVMTMDGLISESVSPRRFSAVLIAVFAALALLLAAVGIYGVMSYTVGQRTHEIGIRMALGAQPADVLRMILRRGMLLAIAGVAAGLAGSLALTRFLATLLFGVQANDPATFVAVTLLLVIVAMAACYVPARRAMQVDPMVALRYE